MTDKHALRMRNYLNTAVISGVKLLHLTTDELSGLLDELEAAEKRIAEQREYYEGVIADGSKRIAELESRTVTLPEPFKLAKSSSGLTYYYADEVDAAIQAAGIGVKGE